MRPKFLTNTSPVRILIIFIIVALVATLAGAVMISSAANQGIDILEIWLRYFLLVLTLPFWILAFVLVATGLITAMFNSLRMLGHIKPNTGALDWKLGFNAFNAIYLPQYLTEQGLTVRKKIFRGVIVFLAGFMIVLPMKLVTEYIFSY